jgi:hypothetical protein
MEFPAVNFPFSRKIYHRGVLTPQEIQTYRAGFAQS